MAILKEFLTLISIYLLGELFAWIIPFPIPGNVIGFILLVILLKSSILKEKDIKSVGDFLLNNLAILFIPGGVGIINVLYLFNKNIIPIIAILVISTVLTIITTSFTIVLIERINK